MWQSLVAYGRVFSFALAITTKEKFRFDAVDLMLEDAGFM